MNKLLLLLPLALLTTVPHAATAKNRLGFVNVAKVMSSLPGGTNYVNLRKTADADIAKQQANLQTLAAKLAKSNTAANKTAFTKAQTAYVNSQKAYQTKVAAAFKPLAAKMNTAIAKVAKANGYSIVMDQQVAATTKLVVYANSASTDLTAAVIKAAK